jgi:lipopolysaccharide export system protein LptA
VRHIFTLVSIILLTLNASFPSVAQTSMLLGGVSLDPNAPVNMTSDKLSISQADGSARFEGNVVIGQGDMRISAGLVIVTYLAEGRIDQLTASGGVTLVTKNNEAESETADYSLTNNTLVMNGNVLLKQGQNAISAETMNVDLATGSAVLIGRVRTVLKAGSN